MNFDFSDDQKQLRDQARRYLAEHSCPKAVRAVLDGAAPYDRELWKGLAGMGFLGVAIPEAFGGAGAGHLELCLIAEEMGRALAPVPFSSSIYLAAEAIMLAGSEVQKQKYLPGLASGETIGTLALFEGSGNPSPRAVKAGVSNSALSGKKVPVPDGAIADIATVAARTGQSGRDPISRCSSSISGATALAARRSPVSIRRATRRRSCSKVARPNRWERPAKAGAS
jgi:acyl-CoA dehydrogenase